MKSKFYTMCMLIAAFITLSVSAFAADLRIGVVDMAELMRQYDKAKHAEAMLKEKVEDLRAERAKRRQNLAEMEEDYLALDAEADDPALKDSVRERVSDAATDKLTELKKYQVGAANELVQLEKSLNAERRRVSETLIDDLRLAVQKYGRGEGYDLVLNSASVIHIVPTKVDEITKQVAATLNR